MLRPWMHAFWWVPASVAGFFASFLFVWVFIAAVGLTMSLAQSFCFRVRRRFFIGAGWTVLGAVGWLAGLLMGGLVLPPSTPGSTVVFYTLCSLTYAAALLPVLFLIRRHAAMEP